MFATFGMISRTFKSALRFISACFANFSESVIVFFAKFESALNAPILQTQNPRAKLPSPFQWSVSSSGSAPAYEQTRCRSPVTSCQVAPASSLTCRNPNFFDVSCLSHDKLLLVVNAYRIRLPAFCGSVIVRDNSSSKIAHRLWIPLPINAIWGCQSKFQHILLPVSAGNQHKIHHALCSMSLSTLL